MHCPCVAIILSVSLYILIKCFELTLWWGKVPYKLNHYHHSVSLSTFLILVTTVRKSADHFFYVVFVAVVFTWYMDFDFLATLFLLLLFNRSARNKKADHERCQ